MSQTSPGQYIIINGPCSVGKTSTAQHLQNLLPSGTPNILLGIDAFHLAIPPKTLEIGHGDPNYLKAHEKNTEHGIETTIVHGPFIEKINQARFQAITHFLNEGVNVIADELFWKPADLKPLCHALKGYPVILIGITADAAVGSQREQARSQHVGNAKDNYRPSGMHLASRITHRFMQYDFSINSSDQSPEECAHKILEWLESQPKISAFEKLCQTL
jgi:chloramphenicol 3-O phosphotransferase